MIIVPRALDAGDRGALLARELSRLDHADVYMAPRVREAIRAGAAELERMHRSLKPNAIARRRGAATNGRLPTAPPREPEAQGAGALLDDEPHDTDPQCAADESAAGSMIPYDTDGPEGRRESDDGDG